MWFPLFYLIMPFFVCDCIQIKGPVFGCKMFKCPFVPVCYARCYVCNGFSVKTAELPSRLLVAFGRFYVPPVFKNTSPATLVQSSRVCK